MKTHYFISITEPKNHIVSVKMQISTAGKQNFSVFLPSWSPGSYLMREYARHVRSFRAETDKGVTLEFIQVTKGTWEIKNPNKVELVEINYEVYCHELTVRTSHVDETHAFLHGPTYLMGIINEEIKDPKITLKFSPAWSKVSTGLKDASQSREDFTYTAKNYDELIDAPVEIGCHETDGFMVNGVPHELAFYGKTYPGKFNLKEDMKKIVEHISGYMGGIPYEKYTFITHFVPKIYGGLEHLNSTALHFDGRKLGSRKDYINWLALVAHEYFHTWNVKRIRPKELGPFDYLNEGYTKMLWLAEGLTSFMDDLFVLRTNLCSLEEYLEVIKGNLDTYYTTPGKKFHSLEDSSFNAWVKLYRPDENSKNSSISYYLKGGLVFSILNIHLREKGKSVDDLLKLLWQDYQNNPERGVTTEDVFKMVESLGGATIRETFEEMVTTTKDIDFEGYYKKIGLGFKWEVPAGVYLGVDFEYKADRALIKSVTLDSPAYKSGLNAGDEILAINGLRFLKEDADQLAKLISPNVNYDFLISRLEMVHTMTVQPSEKPKTLKEIVVLEKEKVLKGLGC